MGSFFSCVKGSGGVICTKYGHIKKVLLNLKDMYEDKYILDEDLNKHVKEVIGSIVQKKVDDTVDVIRNENVLFNKFLDYYSKEKDDIIKALEEKNCKLKEELEKIKNTNI